MSVISSLSQSVGTVMWMCYFILGDTWVVSSFSFFKQSLCLLNVYTVCVCGGL